jgi:hypothetical protein
MSHLDKDFNPQAASEPIRPSERKDGQFLIDLKVPGVCPDLIRMLSEGRKQMDCARTLGLTRSAVRFQIEKIKRYLLGF